MEENRDDLPPEIQRWALWRWSRGNLIALGFLLTGLAYITTTVLYHTWDLVVDLVKSIWK